MWGHGSLVSFVCRRLCGFPSTVSQRLAFLLCVSLAPRLKLSCPYTCGLIWTILQLCCPALACIFPGCIAFYCQKVNRGTFKSLRVYLSRTRLKSSSAKPAVVRGAPPADAQGTDFHREGEEAKKGKYLASSSWKPLCLFVVGCPWRSARITLEHVQVRVRFADTGRPWTRGSSVWGSWCFSAHCQGSAWDSGREPPKGEGSAHLGGTITECLLKAMTSRADLFGEWHLDGFIAQAHLPCTAIPDLLAEPCTPRPGGSAGNVRRCAGLLPNVT